jgi:hypothetical protein
MQADPDDLLRDIAKRNGRHAPELATILLAGTKGQ